MNQLTSQAEWTPATSDNMPPDKVEVETKIDDAAGVRNETTLKRYRNLWFFPDMSMYVYYKPTHWRHLAKAQGGQQ